MKHLAIWYFDIGWLLILPVYGLWGWACGAKMVSASTTKNAAVTRMPYALLLSITPPILIGGIMFLIKHG